MKATEIEQPSSNLTGKGLPANKGVEEAQKSPCRLTVVEANPQTDARWETFVNQHPCGSIYHHPAWLKALELEYGHKGNYLLCEDDAGGVLAILPLSRTRGLPLRLGGALSGRRLSSLPRTPVAGPLSIDRRATAAVLENAVKRVSNDVVTQVQIKTQSTEIDGLVDGMACMPWRLSYVLRLQNNFDSQFRVPDAAHRHNIGKAVRKALKLGVNVRPAETAGDLEAWYALYLDTMRRNFVPARPFRFFVALWEILQPKAMFRLLLAEQKQGSHDKIIAGAILLKFGRTVSFAFAGSSQANLALRPNDIIFWKAINEACSEGFEAFDFGEVPEDRPDLARYKGKWGAEPIRLYRYHYPAPQSNPAIVESTGFAKRLAHGVWRHLPLRATAYLSDRVYRFL